MKDASETKKGRGKGKAKAIKETALEAGLAAFAALESSDVVARPVTITARTLVREGIESIMKARERGVPLLRIYSDAKKAAGLKIGFQTFAGYVSEAARDKGLKLEKVKTAPRKPASANAGTVGAVVQDQDQEKTGFNCEYCSAEAKIYVSNISSVKFWHCSKCNSFYCDDNETLTSKRLDESIVAEIVKK